MRVETSISRMLITRIVLFSSTITLAITVFQLWTTWREDFQLIDQGFQHIQTSVLPTVSNAIWVGDDRMLNIALTGMAALPYVAQVEVTTNEKQGGNTHLAGSSATQPLLRIFPMLHEDWQKQMRHIGDLHITVELNDVYSRLWERGFLLLGVNFLKALAVVGFMILLFERSVARHLRDLAVAFQNFSPYQDFSEVRFDRKQTRTDELSVLAGTFNIMGQTIRSSWLEQRRYEEELGELNQQLEAKQELLEAFVQHTPASVAMFDQEMRYLLASEQWIQDYALEQQGIRSAAELVGRSYYDIFPEIREMPHWIKYHQDCLAGIPSDRDRDPLIREDGKISWIHWKLLPWHDEIGFIAGLIMFTQNVTDEVKREVDMQILNGKLAEENQRAQDALARVQALVETAPDAILTLNEQGIIEFTNRKLLNMFGYPPQGLIDQNIGVLLPTHDTEVQDDSLEASLQNSERKNTDVIREFTALRKDDSTFPAELSVGEFSVAGEKKFTGFIRDISEQKAYEEEILQLNVQLQETNATLEERVVERTRDLEIAHQTMVQQERLASLGTLVAGVAHEMKNPLGLVVNFTKLLDQYTADLITELKQEKPDQEEIEALIDDISEVCPLIATHGERAVDITNMMLNHSRSNGSQTWAEVNVHKLLHEYVNIAYHAFRANHQRINIEQNFKFDEKSPLIWGSALRLGQVFLNIINNAFDALKGKLDRELDFQAILTVRTVFEKGYLTVEITDNGPGIPQSIQKQIFDAFFTTKGPNKGTGLGLSLSHSIVVEEHKGTLHVQSTEGVGTTFFIRLPKGQERKEL